jgi:hypothetical protein
VWFFLFIGEFFTGLAIVTLTPSLHILGNTFIIIGMFFLLPASDSISRDFADPVKFMIYTILSMSFFFTIQDPNAVFVFDNNGMPTIYWKIEYLIGWFIPIAFGGIIYLYNTLKMAIQTPTPLKKYSVYFLLSFILSGFVAPLIYLTMHLQIYGFEYVLQGIGIICISIVLMLHPQLIYILPFKAVRLTVMETNGGIPLFTHIWETNNQTRNDLYSTVLQGINLIFKESLNEGDVKEVQLSEAILMVHRSQKFQISYVLVAKKSSKTLRDHLKIFAMKFEARYNLHFKEVIDLQKFYSATELIEECFPFVH